MCGIAGIVNKAGHSPQEREIQAMTDCIVHRGPDDHGIYIDANCGLGFRRLSILDLAHGHQPMLTEDNRYAIIFNGEIYNHLDVRLELDAVDNRPWRTTSDTETILRAWEHWQTDSLRKLAGMFGMAIWDSLERRLFIARDRAGKKPVYFYKGTNAFVFGSEVKSLLAHPATPCEMDEDKIPAWVTYRFLPGKETLFRDIHPLPMGTWISIDDSGRMSEPKSFWDHPLPCVSSSVNNDDLIAALEQRLTDSVATRMVADVPVGAFLSGGLDSSMICALIRKTHPGTLKTFSVGFDTGFSEASIAKSVSQHLETDHHEFIAGSNDMLSVVSNVLWSRETPISEPSDLAIYKLSEMARREVTVVLSGEGSDETLGGYPKYQAEQKLQRVPFSKPVLSAAARIAPAKKERANTLAAILAENNSFERFARWFGAFGSKERAPLLGKKTEATCYSQELAESYPSAKAADLTMYLDFREWLPANLLLRGDRMTMAHSLELRCPFLDHRLVDFAISEVPSDFRLRGPGGKFPLRALADKYLPADIRKRQKWGFKLPVGTWLRGPWKKTFEAVVLAPDSASSRWYRMDEVERIWNQHIGEGFDHSKKLWCLLQLELWHRMFITQELGRGEPLPEEQRD